VIAAMQENAPGCVPILNRGDVGSGRVGRDGKCLLYSERLSLGSLSRLRQHRTEYSGPDSQIVDELSMFRPIVVSGGVRS
jgi:hypothetical protein